jgi:chorismate mutase/prephenate dehydratase
MVEINDGEILELRKKIDAIDKNILIDLEERFELVNDIARLKKNKNLPIRDRQREEEVIKSKYGLTELPEDFVARLFRLIIDESLRQGEES